jgi:hypothetical protein
MKKAKFEYLKEDGSKSERLIINPSFLKESFNSYKDFNKNDVKYLSGYEINPEGLSQEQLLAYENCIKEYYSDKRIESEKCKHEIFQKRRYKKS